MQKKVLALHDLAGLGRSSLVPIIAVLSAMGHQCVPVPTACYSSHLALSGWQCCDLTGQMRPALAQYAGLGLRFDAAYAGFLSSAEQIGIVAEAAGLADLLVIDPVLGDNGRLYSSVTPELCAQMARLCSQADVMTPNVTEAAVLLGLVPEDVPRGEEQALVWARRLWERFGASVVLTGLALREGELAVSCCENGTAQLVRHARIGAYYPGTGDIFAAVLTGALLSGRGLLPAARQAADFVRACIAATEAEGIDRLQGVQFERQLRRLWESA